MADEMLTTAAQPALPSSDRHLAELVVVSRWPSRGRPADQGNRWLGHVLNEDKQNLKPSPRSARVFNRCRKLDWVRASLVGLL
jgi:hypothetical protein